MLMVRKKNFKPGMVRVGPITDNLDGKLAVA